MRALLRSTPLLALLVLLTGCASSGNAAAAPAWRVDAKPFKLTFTHEGRPLVAQFAGSGVGPAERMGYTLADGSRHGLTELLSQRAVDGGTEYAVATDEPSRRALVTVRKTPRGLRVEWRLQPAAGVEQVFETFAATGAERFLGSGQNGGPLDLTNRIVPLKVWFNCNNSIPVPFFMSSTGYGVHLDTTAVGQMQFRGGHAEEECKPWLRTAAPLCPLAPATDRVQLCVKASALDYELYAGDFEQMLDSYTAHAGRPKLPPPSQLALIKWRDQVAGAAELLDDVEQLQRRGIPLGWVLLDNPWEEGCFGTLRWDTSRIPDPAGTIRAVHDRGVRFMLWLAPYLRRASWCPEPDYRDGEVLSVGGPLDAVDLTHPEARRRYEERLRAVLALGVDGVKGDRGDEVDLEGLRFAGGDGTRLHNAYPNLFAHSVTRVLRELRGDDFATMFRSGTSGAQRVLPGIWAGDQPGSFAGLQTAIRMAQSAGVSGFPVWGSDVGGYISADPAVTAEVFVRWAQLGAVSPIFEVGGQGPNARFWEWGEPTVDLFRSAALLHYELFPYLYELARRASATGAPIIRPLAFRYPRDERAWAQELQFLVGEDLLAAPVTSGGTPEGAPVAARVYLPAGTWLDLHSGRSTRGPAEVVRPTPLSELPLYLRRGAAIPFNLRSPDVWKQRWDLNDLDRRGRAGWMYAPGEGATEAASRHAGSFRARRAGRTVTLSVRSSPAEVQVLLLTPARPASVRIGGRALRASSAEQLRGRELGWTWKPGPFGGVVLKLAPRRLASQAEVVLGRGG